MAFLMQLSLRIHLRDSGIMLELRLILSNSVNVQSQDISVQ